MLVETQNFASLPPGWHCFWCFTNSCVSPTNSMEKAESLQINMKLLPRTSDALVLRVDFSNQTAWELICKAIQQSVGEFQAHIEFVSDLAFKNQSIDQLIDPSIKNANQNFIFVVDQIALTHPENPILVVDLLVEPGRTFRVIPSEMWAVENNLSISNLDFSEFADSADTDGIFRGFREN